jgi:thiol-disulfide isomerase/thioredoxin
MNLKQGLGLGLIAVAAAAAGLGLSLWLGQARQSPSTTRAQVSSGAGLEIGSQRPGFALPDIHGQPHTIDEWDGEVLLVNFWATWCPPCKKEIPAFIRLQERYGDAGLQVIGIAIDQVDLVRDFATAMGVNYPLLVGELGATEVTQAWGNRYGTLPYSVLVDRDGRIAATKLGELTEAEAETLLHDLL